MAEANSALENARLQMAWNSKATNNLIFNQVTLIPAIGHRIRAHYGYEGSYIQNPNPRSKNTSWEITHKRFLP
jgi:hypothetical protein